MYYVKINIRLESLNLSLSFFLSFQRINLDNLFLIRALFIKNA